MRWPTSVELIGIALATALLMSLYKAHKSEAMADFNLFDLLMENGKVSKLACVFMGSWTALTYVFVGLYLTGKMTDTLYAAYGSICFAPIIVRMFSGASTTTLISNSSSSNTEITKKE